LTVPASPVTPLAENRALKDANDLVAPNAVTRLLHLTKQQAPTLRARRAQLVPNGSDRHRQYRLARDAIAARAKGAGRQGAADVRGAGSPCV